MALQKQKFSISFSQGVDTKTDDKQVLPGKLLSLENGILTKTGKIVKRNGYNTLGNQLTSGAALAKFQNELITYSGTNAFSYSSITDTFLDKGPLNVIKINSGPVIRNTYQQTNADSAIHSSGLQVFTWTDARGGCRYSCVDSLTGQIVVSDSLVGANASKAKPIALGNYIVIIYYDTVLLNIRCLPIPVLNPSTTSTVFDVATSMNTTNPNFDAALIGQRVYVAHNSTSGGGSVRFSYINATLNQSSIKTTSSQNADTAISIFGDATNNNVYVAFVNAAKDVKYFIWDYQVAINVLGVTTIDSPGGGTAIKNITGCALNNSGFVYYTITDTPAANNFIKSATISSTGVTVAAANFVRSVSINGKAFYYAGVAYLCTVFETPLQPTIFILNQSGVVVGKLCFQLAGGTTVNNMVSNTYSIDEKNFLFAFTKKDLLDSISGDVYTQTGIDSAFIEFTPDNSFQDVELGYNLHTTGGLIQMYDGISFVEHGFNYYPEAFSNSINTGAGSITAGTRQYAVTYEWLDNQGQTHRSTTSVPLSVVNTGSTNTNTLTIPTLRLTEKKGARNAVQIVVYRTVAAGTVFYQVSSITSPTYNTTTSNSVTFSDSLADSSIIGNNFIYTNGGVADNAQAEATSLMTSYKGRIVYVPSENPFSWNYSKQTVPGTPVEFYDQQADQFDARGGKITAIEVMDSYLIFFKEKAIFALNGDGPDSTGGQNDFSIPQLITTDGGCIDASSVVATPLGLMYKSAKGIYLLDRGLSVKYIGKDVEAYNNDTILSATLVSNKNQVRFALNTDKAIVYDYLMDQWYVFTNHFLMVDTISYDDVFTYLRSDGIVYQENNTFSDNGTYIKMRIKTGWFSMAGIQAFQRIYKAMILGNYISKHKLKMALSYDFNDIETEDIIIDAYDLLNNPAYGDVSNYGDETFYGGSYPLYQFLYRVPRQKCESIQVTIEDIQTDEVGEGYQLSSLMFELGIKQGLNKLSHTRQFS